MATELIELLAELEHQQWAKWTEYMLDNMTEENIARWRRQIATPYAELSEREKDSDRKEARLVICVLAEGEWHTLTLLAKAAQGVLEGMSNPPTQNDAHNAILKSCPDVPEVETYGEAWTSLLPKPKDATDDVDDGSGDGSMWNGERAPFDISDLP